MTTTAIPIRGVHLDCRAQMMRFARMVEVLEDLARWGFNTVLIEYEDRFPYTGRLRRVVADDALTRRQIRELHGIARGFGIRIIPLVQCLGHLDYVLRHAPFRSLAEPPCRWGSAYSVCPSHPKAQKLVREMASQVLDAHPDARWFHMGGDEAPPQEACKRCGPRIRRSGASEVLIEHFVAAADWIRGQGPDPIIWCDMPLSHPEALDRLRGRVTVMDWDYWSPKDADSPPHVWGITDDPARPETWPKLHRELFADRVFAGDGKTPRPFPYTSFLRDHGFQVIVAPAVRCSGDTFCVPFPHHVDNAVGAAKVAAQSHVLGSVITSWALRRSPWPLTEYALIAGGMTMNDPNVSRRAVDAAFAEEHFGVADPAMAKIARLLGAPVTGYLEALPAFDADTGRWPGRGYDQRIEIVSRDVAKFRRQLARLQSNIARARPLLTKARPTTARQRYRVRLWKWASDLLDHFVEFGPEILKTPGTHDRAALRRSLTRAGRLGERTQALLGPLYTDRTMQDEQQTRFGTQEAYIRDILGTARKLR